MKNCWQRAVSIQFCIIVNFLSKNVKKSWQNVKIFCIMLIVYLMEAICVC